MHMKECFKCLKAKPLDAFYKHKDMSDGHVNKCKECNKKDVRENYAKNRVYYAMYDKKRQQNPERRASKIAYMRKHRIENPIKTKARVAVYRMKRKDSSFRKPCEVCGDTNPEAHHDDYNKPLEVNWLCKAHHKEREGKVPVLSLKIT